MLPEPFSILTCRGTRLNVSVMSPEPSLPVTFVAVRPVTSMLPEPLLSFTRLPASPDAPMSPDPELSEIVPASADALRLPEPPETVTCPRNPATSRSPDEPDTFSGRPPGAVMWKSRVQLPVGTGHLAFRARPVAVGWEWNSGRTRLPVSFPLTWIRLTEPGRIAASAWPSTSLTPGPETGALTFTR